MKKLFVIILILFFVPIFALADDGWDSVYENDVDIHQPVPVVTDKEFQEAYDSKVRKKKKKDPYADIKAYDMEGLNKLDGSYPSVVLYQKFYTDDNKILQEGFYKAVVVLPKENDKDKRYFVHFYQGHSHKGKLQMYETDEDYDEPNVNYAKMIDNNGQYKFIYGTIDCSLECDLSIVRE